MEFFLLLPSIAFPDHSNHIPPVSYTHLDVYKRQPLPGLFAAGDCTGGMLQIAKAVYEGALAGTRAVDYLKSKK